MAHSHEKKARLLSVIMLVLISVSAGFVGGWAGSQGDMTGSIGSLSNESKQQIVLNESQLISDIAKQVGPSVVSVNVTSQSRSQSFFSFGELFESQSAGTGFIIREDGIVVTNRHVIPSNTSKVSVTLSDGTELTDVEVIGRTGESDPLDVAFLKINDTKGKDLTVAELGDSSQIQVGEKVVAIGNALGQFQNTVTSGIISGYGRSVVAGSNFEAETLQNLFQTDAAINQGNSGGPLVNIKGHVIGINTAVAGGGAENIGFSIPINDVKGLINSVLERGVVERPFLGVRYVSLTDDIAFNFELDVKRGAFIVPTEDGEASSVLDDSPAAKAGLQEGDVITKIDNEEIDEDNSLVSLVGRKNVGDTITLTIIRDGNEQAIDVTLEAAPTE
mgnify:CR=1 FL=1